jgi:hypothetical protein
VSDQALHFRDRFLHEAVQTVERRRKGLASRGELTVSAETTGDGERALLVHAAGAAPVVVLALSAGHRADVYLCAPEPRRTGKVLVKIEGLVLGGDVKRLLAAFEWTIGAARRLDPDGRSIDAGHLGEIVRRWRTLHQGAVP